MKMSDVGLQKLIDREGSRPVAYKDTKGIWTIGVGHTGPEVVQGLVWSNEQIMEALRKDVSKAEDAINLGVSNTLSQNQFDALVSFTFNIGVNAFLKSTMLKLINQGDFEGATAQFNRWVIPPEITGRRMSEKAQFSEA